MLGTASVDAGTYAGIEVVLSGGFAYTADGAAVPVELGGAGSYFIDTDFEVLVEDDLYVPFVLVGLELVAGEDGSLVAALDLTLAETVAHGLVQVGGVVETVRRDTSVMTVSTGDSSVAVDFADAGVFLPGDGEA